jgi:hypothetical protein
MARADAPDAMKGDVPRHRHMDVRIVERVHEVPTVLPE